jgi:hypothetical protein
VSDALIVFLKHPTPGRVKTRLAACLGEADAASLYRAIAEELMRRTRSRTFRRLAFHAPDATREAMDEWMPGEDWHVQSGADLGERMHRAFETAFATGARRVAIVGSDLPRLGEPEVRGALDALAGADVVVGPARDGGYYLLALKRPEPGLFTGIAWSTDTVLQATLERARSLGLSVQLLETRSDVDTAADVREHWPTLRAIVGDPALVARIEEAFAAW